MKKVELHGDVLGLVHPISEPSRCALKCLRLLGARNRPLPLDDVCRDSGDAEFRLRVTHFALPVHPRAFREMRVCRLDLRRAVA